MKRQNVKYFTEDEKLKLLRTLDLRRDSRRDAFLFRLMFGTGLRLNETMNLNVGHVLDRKRLIIIGKGDKQREIPLSKQMCGHIVEFLRWKKRTGEDLCFSAPLFISRKHRRLGSRAVQYALDKWVEIAGLEGHYSPHALRHTVGFELMRKTGNIRKVQEYLGHSFVTTTQIYTHVTTEDLEECAELLST